MEQQVSKDRERKKAAAEMLVLGLLEERNRHGYEIAKAPAELVDLDQRWSGSRWRQRDDSEGWSLASAGMPGLNRPSSFSRATLTR